ncbi:MAG: cupin domain-containing protein [Muribaculaceae bacterium]|nr:cupin domain-containing protein [Muribaculaceae bacterium]
MNLNTSLDYKPQGIASRVLVQNESGIIMMLAFDIDVDLATHTAPADVMVQIIEGTAEITVDDVTHTLRAGDFITMRPGTPHSLRAPEQFKALVIQLSLRSS